MRDKYLAGYLSGVFDDILGPLQLWVALGVCRCLVVSVLFDSLAVTTAGGMQRG